MRIFGIHSHISQSVLTRGKVNACKKKQSGNLCNQQQLSFHNVRDERENDEIRLIDPDRNVGHALISNRTPACADGLVSPSIAAALLFTV